MKEKLKKLGNKKLIIDSVLFILLLIFVILFLKKDITNLEKIKLQEKSNEISDYFEEVLTEDKDKYINFAVEYLYNTSDKEAYSIDEVLEVINNNFNIEYTSNEILELGITKTMQEKGIIYDASINGYRYLDDLSVSDIASKKITYFKVNKMKKVDENKFVIVYNKFIIDNPYEVLNYYNNLNLENETKIDTTNIVKYLKGEGKVGLFKKVIKEEKNNFGKSEGTIEVTYIIKDNKLLIDKIK